MVDFPIYKDEDRLTYLAYFYERLAQHLLHLPLVSPKDWLVHRGSNHFDIVSDTLHSYIEVKGVSNNDQLKLFEDQLQSQLNELELEFPAREGIIWIFVYRNRAGADREKPRPRLLKGKSGKTWASLSQFLSDHTVEAIAIDVHLFEMLYRQNGTCDYLRDKFNPRKMVKINRSALKLFAENARSALSQLGMLPHEVSRWLPPNARRLLPRTIEANFDGQRISFKLILIAPNGFRNRFLRRLNGTVQRH